MSFADKVVWITGASSGIGEALALEFSRYGAKVVLSARREQELERVRKSMVWPENHLCIPLDVTDQQAIDSATEQVKNRYGQLDFLVLNSGISQRSLVIETDLEVDRRIMEVNYFAPIYHTKAVLPWLREQGSGKIVVISSLVGELATPTRSAYCASKHALHGWYESLRAEEFKHGLTILMVMPGFVRTNVSINALSADGSSHGQMDQYQENGMKPDVCAERIIDAVQRGKEVAIIAGRETVGVYLKRWFPALYRRIIRRIRVT